MSILAGALCHVLKPLKVKLILKPVLVIVFVNYVLSIKMLLLTFARLNHGILIVSIDFVLNSEGTIVLALLFFILFLICSKRFHNHVKITYYIYLRFFVN